ncbi:phage holin family protein [Paenibacillus cisolokensis]|uniref:phage holin family protein n=1 Tax=Paenibacillus cisolokensis TaxID=1658519 RepID=UPI003D2ADFD4
MQQLTVSGICALVGSIITFSFGVWPETLTFLLVAMGVDYVTGIAASLKEKKGLSSLTGAWGLARKGLTLLVIMLTHRIDVLLGTEGMAMGAAIYFYIANELISIVENYGRLGLPLPDSLRRSIALLKDRTDDDDDTPSTDRRP